MRPFARSLLVLLPALVAQAAWAASPQPPGYEEASGPAAVEPGAAPTSLPTRRPSVAPTPGYVPKASPSPRLPYEAAWEFSRPGPAVLARHGAVACVSAVASHVGVEVLKAGGNAVDAAVAVALALAVVYPEAGNIGGGGFLLVHDPKRGAAALDYRETAPARAHARMYLDAAGNATADSQIGARAAGVPGTVAGLAAAHARLGKRPWASLVAPAIKLARDGFVVNGYLAGSFHRAQDLLLRFDETRRVFLPNDLTPRAGDVLKQPDLARTLERIAREGPKGFYQGPVAAAIAREAARQGGPLSAKDLASYQPRWREPVAFSYRGRRILSMPPPSSGGVTLAQILHILEGYDLKAAGWHSVSHLHLLTEADRRAFADRNALLADPDFVKELPVATLLSEAYAARRRATIRDDRATPEAGRAPGLPEPDHTTHFSVVDAAGMAVSNTYTLNGNYGCGVVVPGTGVLLNNEMDDFTTRVGGANQFGLAQGALNAIAPGKRPLSSMTPTIVLGPDGKPSLVLGAPGGPTIITTVAQVLSNVVDFGLPLNWAIAAPRVHHQAQPDLLYHEPHGLDIVTRTELVRLGHQVQARSYIGDAQGIWRRPDGAWEAFSDPRRGGEAFGY
ncbi:MAG: gamma-glutamyltransferase [Candidatus Sericytochromatia bacterium]|nr:gamma-glutamyltransferase [Candidatus Sericytochromatia bacterium]